MNLDLQKEVIISNFNEELKKFKNKDLYKCPCCGHIFEWEDVNYNPEEDTYTCENCREILNESDMQNASIYDFFEDMYLTYKTLRSNKNERD